MLQSNWNSDFIFFIRDIHASCSFVSTNVFQTLLCTVYTPIHRRENQVSELHVYICWCVRDLTHETLMFLERRNATVKISIGIEIASGSTLSRFCCCCCCFPCFPLLCAQHFFLLCFDSKNVTVTFLLPSHKYTHTYIDICTI